MNNNSLTTFGWGEFFERHFLPYAANGFASGRVALEHKHFYRVYTEWGDVLGEIAGKLRHDALDRGGLPVVGDWVAIRSCPESDRAKIHAVLPRKSKFTRKVAGVRTEKQIVASNIDTVFLLTSLNQDFNPRRVERYLVVAWESGAQPIIILTKSDLCDEIEERTREMKAVVGEDIRSAIAEKKRWKKLSSVAAQRAQIKRR